ncbi:MAG: type II secretion system protein [bacterium]|nr:type II secretion system protein [bacterium]
MKNNGGMTLVEVLVSLVIVFIVFLGLSASGLVVLNENIKNDFRDEAVNVAEQEMIMARRFLFDNIVTIPAYTVPRQIRGVTKNFTVTRTVAAIDPDNLNLTVNVAWTRIENSQTRSYNHQVATIVRR